ncbi:MAG TPA: hypothetical protein PKV91_07830 [Bacillota bacterium]|jgi:hypothetical protein|nr:hypothetical protein [Bacillota bacterium]HOA36184.1 hypothetical protein [Bacillota bacterium]HOJ84227.1 hypothetical protein [Bacillota bacterium]HOL16457.1 hypothetical protein [Bacillota bacterium]HPZ12251.1 hypothetical protein [Bacillota bacterium]
MYFANLAGPIALVVMTAIMFLLVPWERIQRYLPAASVFGVGLGTATYYILQNIVRAWHFQNADLFSLAGIPLFMILAWIPYTIIYFHLLAQYRTLIHVALLILFSAAVPSFFHFLLGINGMVIFNKWAWWDNFFYALAVYNTLAIFIFHRFKLATEV